MESLTCTLTPHEGEGHEGGADEEEWTGAME